MYHSQFRGSPLELRRVRSSQRCSWENRCSENMQKIYRRTPMPKWDFSNNFIEISLRHLTPVNLLYIFKTPFYKNTIGGLPQRRIENSIKHHYRESTNLKPYQHQISINTKILEKPRCSLIGEVCIFQLLSLLFKLSYLRGCLNLFMLAKDDENFYKTLQDFSIYSICHKQCLISCTKTFEKLLHEFFNGLWLSKYLEKFKIECKESLVPSLPSRNKTLVIAVKSYANIDMKVFSSCPILLDFFVCSIYFVCDCSFYLKLVLEKKHYRFST